MTVAATAAVVVAGMVAVSESVVVVAVQMIETGSSQGITYDFCRGPHPIPRLSSQLFTVLD